MYRKSVEPNYESTLGFIKHLGSDDLKELINNDDNVAKLVKNVQQCKDLETEKEMLMAQNKSLAEYNLSLQPRLETGKEKLKELSDVIQALCDSVNSKQTKLRNHSGNLSSDTALALLQTAAAESEEESEMIAEKFYRKDLEIEEFLEQFEIQRKQMHLRRVKADKMNDIITKKQLSGIAIKKQAPAAPYPTGPSLMPRLPK